jgi:cytoskeletal protein RodZ
MKKSFGFGKKNLYLGLAFLVVVGLLSLFVFSAKREGFYYSTEPTVITALTADQRNATATKDKKTTDKKDKETTYAVLTTANVADSVTA